MSDADRLTPRHDDRLEDAYSIALEAVASGATRDETIAFISSKHAVLTENEIDHELRSALRDARIQGVEREDIDPSWLGSQA